MTPNKILRKCVCPPLEDVIMSRRNRVESERPRCRRHTREHPALCRKDGTRGGPGRGRKDKLQLSQQRAQLALRGLVVKLG